MNSFLFWEIANRSFNARKFTPKSSADGLFGPVCKKVCGGRLLIRDARNIWKRDTNTSHQDRNRSTLPSYMSSLILSVHKQKCRHWSHPEQTELMVVCREKLPLQQNMHASSQVLSFLWTYLLSNNHILALCCTWSKYFIEIEWFALIFSLFARVHNHYWTFLTHKIHSSLISVLAR